MESTTYRVDGRTYTVRRVSTQLQHHGVKGMKWGVRRYQNKDGSLTDAGKKRYGDSPEGKARAEKAAKNAKTAKRVAAALVMTATAAAAVAYYRKNPEGVKSVLSKVGNYAVDRGGKAYKAGKNYVNDAIKAAPGKAKQYAKEAFNSAKSGVKEGIKNAPKQAAKKATEAVITGATMMAAKRILDATVGKEESARIFQANNNKKIGSFWKVSPDDKDDD